MCACVKYFVSEQCSLGRHLADVLYWPLCKNASIPLKKGVCDVRARIDPTCIRIPAASVTYQTTKQCDHIQSNNPQSSAAICLLKQQTLIAYDYHNTIIMSIILASVLKLHTQLEIEALLPVHLAIDITCNTTYVCKLS